MFVNLPVRIYSICECLFCIIGVIMICMFMLATNLKGHVDKPVNSNRMI